jgi:hypothetical protein
MAVHLSQYIDVKARSPNHFPQTHKPKFTKLQPKSKLKPPFSTMKLSLPSLLATALLATVNTALPTNPSPTTQVSIVFVTIPASVRPRHVSDEAIVIPTYIEQVIKTTHISANAEITPAHVERPVMPTHLARLFVPTRVQRDIKPTPVGKVSPVSTLLHEQDQSHNVTDGKKIRPRNVYSWMTALLWDNVKATNDMIKGLGAGGAQ